MEKKKSVDVSKWEGNYKTNNPPTYSNLVLENIGLAFLKVTEYRTCDPMFTYGLSECQRLGIAWSGYHFWHQTDGESEARNFVTLAGKSFDKVGLVVDFEPTDASIAQVETKFLSFLLRVEQLSGVKPIIYTGYPYWNKFFPVAPKWLSNYKLWYAAYPERTKTWSPAVQWDMDYYLYKIPKLPPGWEMSQLVAWQFTDKGVIPGMGGAIDLDWYYPDGFLPVAPSEFPKKYRVTAYPRLNVRDTPSQTGTVVGAVIQDTVVDVFEVQDGWGRIEKPIAGWASMAYLETI